MSNRSAKTVKIIKRDPPKCRNCNGSDPGYLVMYNDPQHPGPEIPGGKHHFPTSGAYWSCNECILIVTAMVIDGHIPHGRQEATSEPEATD